MHFFFIILFLFLAFVLSITESKQKVYHSYYHTLDLDFSNCLISLVAYVLNSDNKLSQKELDYIRRQFVKIFGAAEAGLALRKLGVFRYNNIDYRKVTDAVKKTFSREKRFTLLRLLYGVAVADETITNEEWEILKKITIDIALNISDLTSINALYQKQQAQRAQQERHNYQQYNNTYQSSSYSSYSNQNDRYYSILGLTPSASDDEVKKAYRSLVKKLHPDMVVSLSEDIKKETEEKFRQVQEAYEKISTLRGIK